MAFEGEEDVAVLPSPVEVVELGIEGVVGRELVRVGVVDLGVESDGETDGGVGCRRNLAELEEGALLVVADEGDEVAGGFQPGAVSFLQRELGEEVIRARRGERRWEAGGFQLKREINFGCLACRKEQAEREEKLTG